MRSRVFALLTVALLGCSSSTSSNQPSGTDAGDFDAGADAPVAAETGFADEDGTAPMDGADANNRPLPQWTAFGSRGSDSRWGAPLAFVAPQSRFIGFAGSSAAGTTGGTFALSMADGSWSKLNDVNPPPARYCGCTTYLPAQNQVLLIGGRDDNGPLAPAAWTLDVATSTWTAVGGSVPGGVIGCAAAYVTSLGHAFVFGGGFSSFLSETWSYDPTQRAFTKLSLSAAPPPRADAIAAYDPAGGGGRMLLFAGTADEVTSANHFNDLWAFDGTAWTELHPTGGPPPPRRVAAGGFDAAHRTWLVFGGTIETQDLGDVWLLDVANLTWTNLPNFGAPPARGFASSGFDPSSNSYVIVGGLQQPSSVTLTDGWKMQIP
jgi:hypothetical protein